MHRTKGAIYLTADEFRQAVERGLIDCGHYDPAYFAERRGGGNLPPRKHVEQHIDPRVMAIATLAGCCIAVAIAIALGVTIGFTLGWWAEARL